MSWIIILIGLGASWHFCDLESTAFLAGTLAPFLVGGFLIALVIRIASAAGNLKAGNNDGGSCGGTFWGGGGWGDGGGGCGGDGGGGC